MWLHAIAGQQTTSQEKISLWLALLCVKSMREPQRLCVKLPLGYHLFRGNFFGNLSFGNQYIPVNPAM